MDVREVSTSAQSVSSVSAFCTHLLICYIVFSYRDACSTLLI
nr:MAG TPA: hypothetical protein [Caudoviricetes sp.]